MRQALMLLAVSGALLQTVPAFAQAAYGAAVTAPPAQPPQQTVIQIQTLPPGFLRSAHADLSAPVEALKPMMLARAAAVEPSDTPAAH